MSFILPWKLYKVKEYLHVRHCIRHQKFKENQGWISVLQELAVWCEQDSTSFISPTTKTTHSICPSGFTSVIFCSCTIVCLNVFLFLFNFLRSWGGGSWLSQKTCHPAILKFLRCYLFKGFFHILSILTFWQLLNISCIILSSMYPRNIFYFFEICKWSDFLRSNSQFTKSVFAAAYNQAWYSIQS